MHWLRLLGVVVLCIVGLSEARADSSRRTRAARLYAAAENAALAGDYPRAADLFERADQLVPTPQAMRSAIRSRLAAGQHRLALARAEALLRRYPYDQRSRALAIETLDQLSARFVRVYIACKGVCELRIDGEKSTAPGQTHVVYLSPGKHQVTARFDDRATVTRTVQKEAGRAVVLAIAPPRRPAGAAPDRSGPRPAGGKPGRSQPRRAPRTGPPAAGLPVEQDSAMEDAAPASRESAYRLPRLPLLVGGAATLALGATGVWSYQDAIEAEQAPGVTPGSLDTRRARTRLLLGATALSAAATLTFAIIGAQRDPAVERARSRRGQPEIGMVVSEDAYWIGMTGTF